MAIVIEIDDYLPSSFNGYLTVSQLDVYASTRIGNDSHMDHFADERPAAAQNCCFMTPW